MFEACEAEVPGGLSGGHLTMFGHFKENYNIQRYNNEVRVFEVYKNTKFYALLYADFFPRPGKGVERG